jgi:hypothetical protein
MEVWHDIFGIRNSQPSENSFCSKGVKVTTLCPAFKIYMVEMHTVELRYLDVWMRFAVETKNSEMGDTHLPSPMGWELLDHIQYRRDYRAQIKQNLARSPGWEWKAVHGFRHFFMRKEWNLKAFGISLCFQFYALFGRCEDLPVSHWFAPPENASKLGLPVFVHQTLSEWHDRVK